MTRLTSFLEGVQKLLIPTVTIAAGLMALGALKPKSKRWTGRWLPHVQSRRTLLAMRRLPRSNQ
jgi:hypothetical protein